MLCSMLRMLGSCCCARLTRCACDTRLALSDRITAPATTRHVKTNATSTSSLPECGSSRRLGVVGGCTRRECLRAGRRSSHRRAIPVMSTYRAPIRWSSRFSCEQGAQHEHGHELGPGDSVCIRRGQVHGFDNRAMRTRGFLRLRHPARSGRLTSRTWRRSSVAGVATGHRRDHRRHAAPRADTGPAGRCPA